jgi:hypothetical protein
MSTGQFHGWYIIGALANDFAAVGVDQAISRARAFEKSPNHFLIVPRPGFRAPTDNLTTFSNPFSGASRTLPKPQGKHEKVRFLSSPLVKPWFSQGFSHFLPIALAFLPIHACPCLQVLRRLVRCLGPW